MSQQKIFPTEYELKIGVIVRKHPKSSQILKKDLGGKRFLSGEKVAKECRYCGKVNLITPFKAQHNWKYCNQSCKSNHKKRKAVRKVKERVPVICANPFCLKEFHILASAIKPNNYCCVDCSKVKVELETINKSQNRLEQKIHLEEKLKNKIWFLSSDDSEDNFDIF